MKKYTKYTEVTAVQFAPTEAEKESLAKDPERKKPFAPAKFRGSVIRKDSEGVCSATIQINAEPVTIEEGQWLVKEGDKFSVVSNEEFEDSFQEYVEDEEETPPIPASEPEDQVE